MPTALPRKVAVVVLAVVVGAGCRDPVPCDGPTGCASADAVTQALRGPELSFGGTPRGVPAPFQYTPVVGFDGTQYWVVWQARDRVRDCETMGTRVSIDGGALDRSLTLLPLDTVGCANANDLLFDGQAVALAVDFFGESGDTFLLASLDADGGPVSTRWSGQRPGVYPRSAAGPLPGELMTVTAEGVELRSWRRLADGGVPLMGTLIVPDTGVSPSFAEPAARFDLAWDGTRYLAVWLDERADLGDVRATWLDATGVPLGMPFAIAAGPGKQSHCRVEASGGGPLLVVWQDEQTAGPSRIRGSIVTFAGGVGPDFIMASSPTSDSTRPTAAWAGGTFVVAWLDSRFELRAGRVTALGAVLDPGGRVVSDDIDFENGRVSIAAGPGSQSLVVWLSSSLTTVAKHLEGALPVEMVAFDAHLTAPSQQSPALTKATTGQVLMAWVDNLPHAQSRLTYVFLSSDGGSGPARLATTGSLNEVSAASNGSTSWLAVADDDTARGILVTATGSGNPVQLTTSVNRTSSIATVAAPNGFLTVWSDGRGSERQVYARTSGLDGGLGPEVRMTSGAPDKDSLALAMNAAGVALLVWGADGTASVDGVRLAGMVVLDPLPLHFGGNTHFSRPTVASDGTDFLVVWEEDGIPGDIKARFVGPTGAPGPVFDVSQGPRSHHQPSASWNGRDFVVVWEANDDAFLDLASVTVTRDGGVGPLVQLASTQGETEIMGRIEAVAPGTSWFAWARFDPNPNVAALRVHAQLIIEDPVDAGVVMDAGVMDAGVMDAGVMDAGVMDAGVMDAGEMDAGVMDAGVMDAGVMDAGEMDAGEMDAGEMDAGVMDASVTMDAGVMDAGVTDSGVLMESDGGVADAGVTSDGGVLPDGGTERRTFSVGCGCNSLAPTTFAWAWVFSLVLLKRRRRTSLESS